MNKGIILYRSKYGATRKYAEWLKKATGYDCVETNKANPKLLQDYDTVVLGGGIYASSVAGLSFLKKNISALSGKKTAVFGVGASPYDEAAIEQAKSLHFKEALADIPFFYCRGSWDEEKMTLTDRMLCGMLKKAVAKQDPDTYEPWQKALMSVGDGSCDWTDEKYLEPLLAFLKSE